MITIRAMTQKDIQTVAHIHSEAFSRQFASTKWVTCNFNAHPRILMYVAIAENDQVVGYIQWLQKSGFRKEAVLELEQIAVLPKFQGKKIGTALIEQSLYLVKIFLEKENAILKAILVTTRADNDAQKLYARVLKAKVTATISNLYSADEVVMVAKYL